MDENAGSSPVVCAMLLYSCRLVVRILDSQSGDAGSNPVKNTSYNAGIIASPSKRYANNG